MDWTPQPGVVKEVISPIAVVKTRSGEPTKTYNFFEYLKNQDVLYPQMTPTNNYLYKSVQLLQSRCVVASAD
jgi:hypothetical protein